jgi:hypothetical protein
VPLTKFQAQIARLLAANRTPDSYLAGGAALHFKPNSKRFSNDLDYFHDSVERVATAFAADHSLLSANGYETVIEMNQPGYIRTGVFKENEATKIEWAHDSAWRFMPPVYEPETGYQLHPVDLAINKALALAGRDEPRDFLDIIYVHQEILPLGAVCWAAAGKDPGFTPLSLLELLRRRGKYRPEDFKRLQLTEPVKLEELKPLWLTALDSAAQFIGERPPDEIGCLYYSRKRKSFVAPTARRQDDIVPHFGRPGGVLPKLENSEPLEDQFRRGMKKSSSAKSVKRRGKI